MFEKEVVVDGKGHLIGRLASYVAKELQRGQNITIVRTELINKSGSLFRNRVKFQEYLNRRLVFNPRRCFVHYRSPSRIFWKTVRGMLNYKSKLGWASLERLKTFEGIPAPYDTRKRVVVQDALKALRLKSFRPFCTLGDLCNQVGWKKQAIVTSLETKRKNRALTYYQRKLAKQNLKRKALGLPEIKKINEDLAKLGY